MLTKVKEVSKRLITGDLLCIAIGVVQGFTVQMLGLSSMFPNHVQLFDMLLMVGHQHINRCYYAIVYMANKHG